MFNRRQFSYVYVFISLSIAFIVNNITAINYYSSRQDEVPENVTQSDIQTTRQILELNTKIKKLKKKYSLQEGTEHLLQFGALLRTQILDIFGYLIYDNYDDFSITQIEALHKVYHETLERKYNIFDIVPGILKSPDIRPSKICRNINENVHSCLKENSKLCMNIKKHNKRRLINLSYTPQIYHLSKIQQHFPDGFSLKSILHLLQNNSLKLTPSLLSGLLINVQYDSFDYEVRTAEREFVKYNRKSKNAKKSLLMSSKEIESQKTISGLLKVYLKKASVEFTQPDSLHAKVLMEHVVREVEAISENIEWFGTIYENSTINLKYLLDLILPPDTVDSDLIDAKEYLLRKVNDLQIVSKYLEVEKYHQVGPDQLLLEILGQMKDINFAVDIVNALQTHVKFWHKSCNIVNLNGLLDLFSAYDNLRHLEEYKEMMGAIDEIRHHLSKSRNISIEISCSNPRACLQIGLQMVMKCENIDDYAKNMIKQFCGRVTFKGSPIKEVCPLTETPTTIIESESPRHKKPLGITEGSKAEPTTVKNFDNMESSKMDVTPLIIYPDGKTEVPEKPLNFGSSVIVKLGNETTLTTEEDFSTEEIPKTENFPVNEEVTVLTTENFRRITGDIAALEMVTSIVGLWTRTGNDITTEKNDTIRGDTTTPKNTEIGKGSTTEEGTTTKKDDNTVGDIITTQKDTTTEQEMTTNKDNSSEKGTTTKKGTTAINATTTKKGTTAVNGNTTEKGTTAVNGTFTTENILTTKTVTMTRKVASSTTEVPITTGKMFITTGKNVPTGKFPKHKREREILNTTESSVSKCSNSGECSTSKDCSTDDCNIEKSCEGDECELENCKDCSTFEENISCADEDCTKREEKTVDCNGKVCSNIETISNCSGPNCTIEEKNECKGPECSSEEESSACVGHNCPREEKNTCKGPDCSSEDTTFNCSGSNCSKKEENSDCEGSDCSTSEEESSSNCSGPNCSKEEKKVCEGSDCSGEDETLNCSGPNCSKEEKKVCIGPDCSSEEETSSSCSGPNCSKEGSKDCQGSDCSNEEDNSVNCSGSNCSKKEENSDCEGSDCSTGEEESSSNCSGPNCSKEEEKACTGPDCSSEDTTFNCSESNCSKKEENSDCEGPNCLNSEEDFSNCSGPNCSKEEKKVCVGPDCSSEEETVTCSGPNCSNEENKNCKGSDCSNEKENSFNCSGPNCLKEENGCEGSDCLNSEETSLNHCSGSNCLQVNCTGQNCLKVDDDCKGSDCPDEKERKDCEGDNCLNKESNLSCEGSECPNQNCKDDKSCFPNLKENCSGDSCLEDPQRKIIILCDNTDLNRQRKMERLQKIHQLNAFFFKMSKNKSSKAEKGQIVKGRRTGRRFFENKNKILGEEKIHSIKEKHERLQESLNKAKQEMKNIKFDLKKIKSRIHHSSDKLSKGNKMKNKIVTSIDSKIKEKGNKISKKNSKKIFKNRDFNVFESTLNNSLNSANDKKKSRSHNQKIRKEKKLNTFLTFNSGNVEKKTSEMKKRKRNKLEKVKLAENEDLLKNREPVMNENLVKKRSKLEKKDFTKYENSFETNDQLTNSDSLKSDDSLEKEYSIKNSHESNQNLFKKITKKTYDYKTPKTETKTEEDLNFDDVFDEPESGPLKNRMFIETNNIEDLDEIGKNQDISYPQETDYDFGAFYYDETAHLTNSKIKSSSWNL